MTPNPVIAIEPALAKRIPTDIGLTEEDLKQNPRLLPLLESDRPQLARNMAANYKTLLDLAQQGLSTREAAHKSGIPLTTVERYATNYAIGFRRVRG